MALFDADALGDLDADVLAEVPFTKSLQGTPRPGDVPAPVADLGAAVSEALETAGTVSVAEDAVDIRGHPPDERKARVREAFEARDSGEEFVLVSDRDPTPVGAFLGRLADAPRDAFDPFEVRRATPEDWVLETVRP